MRFGLAALPIALKLPGGLGVLLCLIVAVATLGLTGLDSVENAFKNYSRSSALSVSVSKIETEIIELRGRSIEYGINGSAGLRNAVRGQIADVSTAIESLAKDDLSADRQRQLRSMTDKLDAYKRHFDSLNTKRDERDLQMETQFEQLDLRITSRFRTMLDTVKQAGRFADAAGLMAISAQFGEARAGLSRALLQPNRLLIDAILADVEGARFNVAQLSTRISDAELRQQLTQLAAILREYYDQVAKIGPLMLEAEALLKGPMVQVVKEMVELSAEIRATESDILRKLLTSSTEASAVAQRHILLVAGVALIFGVAVAVRLAQDLIRPVKGLTSAMQAFARADWDREVEGAERGDEIGAMARAVVVFKQNGIAHDAMKSESEQEQEARFRRQQALEEAVAAFETASSSVVEAVSQSAAELEVSARSMASIAEGASNQAGSVAAASEQAMVNVQGLAEAGDRLSSAIAEISQQVAASSRIGSAAVKEAVSVDSQLKELSSAGDRIALVVSIINGLAGQTNLLALNATIEAARAGEAGKGFAVVASEVKALAGQTAKATSEIATIVGSIRVVTDQTIAAVQGMTRTIDQIDQIATVISAAVEEQSITTREIAASVRDTARGAEEVSSNIFDVRQASEATGSAAMQVLSASDDLNEQSARLRHEIDLFLGRVRAA